MNFRLLSLLVAAAAGAAFGSAVILRNAPKAAPAADRPEKPAPPGRVLLIALDGFRGDYFNPEDTPNLWGLAAEAAWSRELIPPFPSLTFPSHVTLATGRPVSGHGIPSNQFYDRSLDTELRFPGEASLLAAEPVWNTATRQGARSLAYDWPLSHSQSGPHAAAYFETSFDPSLSDRERIGRVLDLWENDPKRGPGDAPLRLASSYAKEADSVGHREGPDSPATREAVRRVDALLAEAMERAKRHFDATAAEGEQLHFVFAADHGMAAATHLVNIERVLGEETASRLHLSTSGNLANLYLKDPEAGDAAELWAAVEAAFDRIGAARVFSSATLPEAWAYRFEGRTGERIVVLDRGHTFDRSGPLPVTPLPQSRGPRGMHGYPPEEVAEMKGLLFLLRHPAPLERLGDLGAVRSSQVHATVCAMLGIEAAPDAEPRTVWEGLAP